MPVCAVLIVVFLAVAQVQALSILTYNTKGNHVADWSTNSAQVQAIGRQMAYLNPDVITFLEIPLTNTYQMTNFVKAYLPGYSLATNSGTDGYIRSVIASRFPITRSQKWLDGIDLTPFGDTNAYFTRDLFEAQIAVPSFDKPLHVFTTHLKSGSTSADIARRAAECAAISNYFVTAFLTTNASHPYVLTGDMNETDTNQLSIQRLISAPTGLRLTNPTNPFTGSFLTFSIQDANLTKRFDYIMPCGLLLTNITNSQVFRTDKLTPVPANLATNDSQTASDHLPVLMLFQNPYDVPFQITSLRWTNQTMTLNWQAQTGRVYEIVCSTNLTNWSTIASNLVATTANASFVTNAAPVAQFLRVRRVP